MKYMMLVFETPQNLEARKDAERSPYVAAWKAYDKALRASGAYLGGAPLKDVATATTVRLREGRRHVQDGPFAEGKEELGGFIVIDVPALDAALEWAARCPAAASGAVEVRPIDGDFFDTFEAS